MGTPTGRVREETIVEPARAVVASLRAHRVDTVFGLSGSHVIQIYNALADAPEIRCVTVKHENNAAIAAEVYGRLTGRPGVVIVTAGPGATNSLSGVGGAYAAGAPLVHISGGVPVGAPCEAFHGVDDADFLLRAFTPVTKWSARVEKVGEIPAALARAFEIAVAGRPGPTHVEIAESALRAGPSAFEQVPPRRTSVADGPAGAAPPDLDRLVAHIDAARRVTIVAGKGAWWPRVSAALVDFAQRVGAVVLHTWDGHGAMPTTHPLSAGVWYPNDRGTREGTRLVNDADLVVGIGVRPGTEAAAGLLGAVGSRCVLLDAGDEARAEAGVVFPGVEALAEGVAALGRRCTARRAPEDALEICERQRAQLRQGLAVEMERYRAARPWHIGAAIASLARRMTPDVLVVTDVSNVKLWAPLLLPAFAPESYVQAGTWGAMGYALPGVIAAGLARPDKKVVGLAGDVAFLMSSSDFITLCELRLPVVLAVHHDGQIGMINNMVSRAYGRVYATAIGEVDFVGYARSFGALGIRVDDPGQLDAAWDSALAAERPVLLELRAGYDFPWPYPVGRFIDQAKGASAHA